jgi:hypothetical protein
VASVVIGLLLDDKDHCQTVICRRQCCGSAIKTLKKLGNRFIVEFLFTFLLKINGKSLAKK